MARNRKNTSDLGDDPDFDGITADKPAPSAPVQQPPVPSPSADLFNGRELLARVLGVSVEDIESLTQAKSEAATFVMAAQAQEYAQKMKSQKEQEYIRTSCEKTAQQRTQEVVDSAWGNEPGCDRYRVSVPYENKTLGDPGLIALTIPAHSEAEAEGRYRQVCGIRNIEHRIAARRLETAAAE